MDDRFVKCLFKFLGDTKILGSIAKCFASLLLHAPRFIGVKNLPLAFLEHRAKPIETRPHASNLIRVQVDSSRQLLLGQCLIMPVHQRLFKGR